MVVVVVLLDEVVWVVVVVVVVVDEVVWVGVEVALFTWGMRRT